MAGLEFGEDTGPNPGSEFVFFAGSEFGERTWPIPGLELGFNVQRRDWAKPWFGRFGVQRKEWFKP